MSTTLVTMLFDLEDREKEIGRKQDLAFYLKRSSFVLEQKNPLVIFTEPCFVEYFSKARGTLPTVIHSIQYEDLPFFQYTEKVEKYRTIHPMMNKNVHKDTSKYTVLCWCKFAFMHQIAQSNPFGTRFFGWIDIGILKIAIPAVDCFTVTDPRLSFLCLRAADHYDPIQSLSFYDYERGIIAGGYFTGTKESFSFLYQEFTTLLEEALENQYAPGEQMFLSRIVFTNLDQIRLWHGDYNDILHNYHYPRSVEHFFRKTGKNANKQLVQKYVQEMYSDITRCQGESLYRFVYLLKKNGFDLTTLQENQKST